MKADSLIGTWTGAAQNNNGWEMEITITVSASFQVGAILGTYTIPAIPCAGIFNVLEVRGETLELKTENKEGECGEADSDSLELLSDGTLLYISKGEGWEARGILERASG